MHTHLHCLPSLPSLPLHVVSQLHFSDTYYDDSDNNFHGHSGLTYSDNSISEYIGITCELNKYTKCRI